MELQKRVDRLMNAASVRGLMPFTVSLVSETITGANAAKGQDGTSAITVTALSPQPVVDLRDQYRTVDGAQVKVGDGRLTVSKTAATRAQFEAAAWIDISGTRYNTEGTSLSSIRDTTFTLEVMLARERQ